VHLYDTQYPYVHIVLKSSPEGEGVNPTQTEAIKEQEMLGSISLSQFLANRS
jgi:hypothetical protein